MKKALEGEKSITIGQQIQSFGITIIFLFVLALIFAAFFKNEQQIYNTGTGATSV
jgi:ABC-type Na+ efflux pump permease subunit